MLANLLALIQHITSAMGHHFLEFTRIAGEKNRLGFGACQYKTEKWLQAELIVRLRWTGCYGAVAEVAGEKRADLVVWPVEDANRYIGIMLKCWQNSAQNAKEEGRVLKKDVDWALAQGDRAAIALLPDEVQRGGYTQTVLNVVGEQPNLEWEVPFRDVDGPVRRVHVFSWYNA